MAKNTTKFIVTVVLTEKSPPESAMKMKDVRSKVKQAIENSDSFDRVTVRSVDMDTQGM